MIFFKMSDLKINFDTFELDFLPKFRALNLNELNIEPNEYGLKEIHKHLKEVLPEKTRFIGALNDSYESYTSWMICENYYITSLTNNFDWALFRVYWDELDMVWQIQFDARLKGSINDRVNASKQLLKAVWNNDGIDIYNKERGLYLKLFNKIN